MINWVQGPLSTFRTLKSQHIMQAVKEAVDDAKVDQKSFTLSRTLIEFNRKHNRLIFSRQSPGESARVMNGPASSVGVSESAESHGKR